MIKYFNEAKADNTDIKEYSKLNTRARHMK